MSYTVVEKIWPIMEAAFPPIERRSFIQQQEVMKNPALFVETYEENQELLGFITYWKFQACTYIEHLAVDKAMRGKGIGKLLLEKVPASENTIAFEVEPPVPGEPGAVENKRIRFYERLGFVLDDHEYYQPAYDGSGDKVQLYFMTNLGRPLSDKEYKAIAGEILFRVHGIN